MMMMMLRNGIEENSETAELEEEEEREKRTSH